MQCSVNIVQRTTSLLHSVTSKAEGGSFSQDIRISIALMYRCSCPHGSLAFCADIWKDLFKP